MKHKFTVVIGALLLVSLMTACGNTDSKAESKPAGDSSSIAETTTPEPEEQTTKPESSAAEESKPAADAGQADAKAPDALLNAIWNSYGEDDKFSAAGGDAANAKMNEAGVYGISDAAALDSALGFPAADIDKIDTAASLMHMMNANTFTCGAYQLKNADDAGAVATALKENIMKRQWMCGFPDQLVVATIDNTVVSFFGETETVNTFKTKLQATYSSAKITVDEAIVI